MKSKSVLSPEKERALLRQLQEAVFDLKLEDEELLRFLKYHKYDLAKAEDMLRKMSKWRQDNEVSSYLTWTPPQPLIDDYKFEYIGEDRDEHAVIYLPIGGWHTKKMIEMGYREESLQFRFYLLEKIMESVNKSRKSKFVMVMDMEGLTYKKCAHYETIQFLAMAFKDFEDFYPERLRACYIINAPWAFSYIYNALKHVFSSRTLNKAKIFDGDQKKWKPFLLEKIPEKCLIPVCKPKICCN